MAPKAYDPLDYENIGKSIVEALLDQEPVALPPPDRFQGAGVYAIYYTGSFAAYQRITNPPCSVPIYVGCALPAGVRKGADLVRLGQGGSSLYSRLAQHARNIEAAENLDIRDFKCRHLVVLAVWVRLAERIIIDRYKPIWNVYLDGFGNHDPGRGRYGGARPPWDIVHPGRPWAAKLKAMRTAKETLEELEANLQSR